MQIVDFELQETNYRVVDQREAHFAFAWHSPVYADSDRRPFLGLRKPPTHGHGCGAALRISILGAAGATNRASCLFGPLLNLVGSDQGRFGRLRERRQTVGYQVGPLAWHVDRRRSAGTRVRAAVGL